MGDSWKDEGGRGGIIGTGADARVGIGDSKRRDRREEGWAAAETNGATLPRPSWLRASVMDDVFFLFLPVWCAVSDRPPLHLAAAPGYRSGWGRGVWQQQQHSRKRKKNRIFLILFSLPSLLCNLEVPGDQALLFPKETRHTGDSVQTHKKHGRLGADIRHKIRKTK